MCNDDISYKLSTKVFISLTLQVKMMLQKVNEVNRERTRIAAASSVHDSTRQNGLKKFK